MVEDTPFRDSQASQRGGTGLIELHDQLAEHPELEGDRDPMKKQPTSHASMG